MDIENRGQGTGLTRVVPCLHLARNDKTMHDAMVHLTHRDRAVYRLHHCRKRWSVKHADLAPCPLQRANFLMNTSYALIWSGCNFACGKAVLWLSPNFRCRRKIAPRVYASSYLRVFAPLRLCVKTKASLSHLAHPHRVPLLTRRTIRP